MWLGFALFCLDWRLLLIFVLGFALYYERIMFAEEEYLRRKFPKAFQTWAATTPAIIPRFSLWRPSALPYCWKTMVRREYHGLLGMAFMFFMLDTLGDWIVQHRLVVEHSYVAGLIVCGAIYLMVRMLVKCTRVLHVEGR
jgi:protein-S-isoprenylcysteine O-methyltransferase Ste14